MTDIPHFAMPFRFAAGRAVVAEQDSLPEILGCVEAILRCPVGHRDERPDFGIADQTFRQAGASLDDLSAALADFEPRAAVELTAEEIADLTQRVRVAVRIDQ